MATEEFSGAIDYLVFAFPFGVDVSAGLAQVLARVESGIVEVLDIEAIERASDDTPRRIPISELHGDGTLDLSAFDGAASNILEPDDLAAIVGELPPEGFAIAVIYEDRSMASAAAAWRAAGGRLVWTGGVAVDDLEHALAAPMTQED